MENQGLTVGETCIQKKKQITFFKIRPRKVFSLLDFFLVSSDLTGSYCKSVQLFQDLKTTIQVLNFQSTTKIIPRAKAAGDVTKLYCMVLFMSSRLKTVLLKMFRIIQIHGMISYLIS